MKEFLKKDEVSLINGGYLSNAKGNPVNNVAFVNAQRHAEYVITFAEKAKGKDFEGKPADSLVAFKQEIISLLSKKEIKSFIPLPKEVKLPTTDKLKKEALDFINFSEESTKVEKTNAFLSAFTILDEFEEFGLFFEQEIVKLNKIYTMKEVIAAVKSVIDLLA